MATLSRDALLPIRSSVTAMTASTSRRVPLCSSVTLSGKKPSIIPFPHTVAAGSSRSRRLRLCSHALSSIETSHALDGNVTRSLAAERSIIIAGRPPIGSHKRLPLSQKNGRVMFLPSSSMHTFPTFSSFEDNISRSNSKPAPHEMSENNIKSAHELPPEGSSSSPSLFKKE